MLETSESLRWRFDGPCIAVSVYYYRGGTNKTNPVVGRRFGAFPVADLTAVLVVRSCHGPSPQDRPGGCSDFSIGVVLEMRKEGWNYLKALQYSIGIILYGF